MQIGRRKKVILEGNRGGVSGAGLGTLAPAACAEDKGVSLSREVGRCWSGAGLDRLLQAMVKSLGMIFVGSLEAPVGFRLERDMTSFKS